MRFGSLFSGVGGFDLGFERAGMESAWQVEIDSKASAVLAAHWPGVQRLTDVREVGGNNLETVDLVCGGFPCQDLSVAGKRAGLAGERSGLWREFHRILGELRPEWVVIENVPGLLSSNRGADFAVILQALVELGYGVAWRVLDARYFGVAQRRRRVFIVGHLGDGRAAQVLFEPESLFGDTAPRREAGEGVAGSLGGGAGDRGWAPDTDRMTFVPTAIKAELVGRSDSAGPGGFSVTDDGSMYTLRASKDVHAVTAPTVSSKWAKGTGGPSGDEAQNLVTQPFTFQSRIARNGRGQPDDVVPALRGADEGDTADSKPLVPVGITIHGTDKTANVASMTDVASSIRTKPPGSRENSTTTVALQGTAVRRLTPTECERLQGFPDGWTAGQADSARYKQMGNAVCVPVAEWIGRRIANV